MAEGFVGPACGEAQETYRSSRSRLIYRSCSRQSTVTAGTIFDKTRTPLRVWLTGAQRSTALKIANTKAKKARRAARINLKLCPAPHSSACIASPISPLSQFLSSSPSFFMCPMVGSMAWRRRSSFFSLTGSRRVWLSSRRVPGGVSAAL